MKKIVFFLSNLNGGGAERNIVNIANELIRKGYMVEIVLSKKVGPYLDEVNKKICIIDLKSKRLLISFFKLIKYLKINKVDILFSTIIDTNVMSILTKLIVKKKIKIVIREANTIGFSNKNIKYQILLFLAKILYKYADLIIVNSIGSYNALINKIKIKKERVKIINNAVINEYIFQLSDEKVYHKWINNKKYPIILSVGRLSKQKDHITLIKSINIAIKKCKFKAIILGDGELKYILQEKIRKLKLNNVIEILPFDKNPFKYMKNSDIFILSSIYEGFPNVLIQAIAIGITKIISSDCKSGPSEIIINSEYGELFKVGDYKDLAKKIIKSIYTLNVPNKKCNLKKYYIEEVVKNLIREIENI